jgi:hypothetical protein
LKIPEEAMTKGKILELLSFVHFQTVDGSYRAILDIQGAEVIKTWESDAIFKRLKNVEIVH